MALSDVSTPMQPGCDFDECREPATGYLKTIRGREHFCDVHRAHVREIEREWDRAVAYAKQVYPLRGETP